MPKRFIGSKFMLRILFFFNVRLSDIHFDFVEAFTNSLLYHTQDSFFFFNASIFYTGIAFSTSVAACVLRLLLEAG